LRAHDKGRKSQRDRSQVAGDQEYEVLCLRERLGFTREQASLELAKLYGNDRKTHLQRERDLE
jgi:hypothetical protein